MRFIDRLEKKYGRYAIPNLPKYIIILYTIGVVFNLFARGSYATFLALNPYQVLNGQLWRIVTFVCCAPTSNLLFLIFVLLFYYSICYRLEQVWGSFRFNLYIFTGVIGTIIAAFLVYAVTKSPFINMSTYYLNLSLFLAYAAIFPNELVLLYGFIPLRVKWLGIFDAILLLVTFVSGDVGTRISVVVALLNFILFFFLSIKSKPCSRKYTKRRYEFKQAVKQSAPSPNQGIARHKCAICGRTEKDDPNLEFRFCSKCNGNYEYCQDHLFTHKHIH